MIAVDADPWGSVDAAAEIVTALPEHLVRYEQFQGAGRHIHHDSPVLLFGLLTEFLTSQDGDRVAVAGGPLAITPSG